MNKQPSRAIYYRELRARRKAAGFADINVRVLQDDWQTMRDLCASEGFNMATLVNRMIGAYQRDQSTDKGTCDDDDIFF